MGHILWRLFRTTTQPADADHAVQRWCAERAVGVRLSPAGREPRNGGDAPVLRRATLRDWARRPRVGVGCTNRSTLVDIPARVSLGDAKLLRRHQSRVRRAWRRALYGHGGRAPDCAECERRLVIWESPIADGSKGYSVTMAPLVVKDKVIVGVSGSEFPTRGFIDAYNARTGNREWRFYTVPAPGEPGSDTWPSAKPWRRAAAVCGWRGVTTPI